MEKLISEFMKREFKFSETFYQTQRYEQLLDGMITVLHSQNYKKTDSYILNRDFSIIRSLLYGYSANAKRTFLSNKNYAYIFNHFYNQAGEFVIKEKSEGKSQQFQVELRAEMDDINKKAVEAMDEL